MKGMQKIRRGKNFAGVVLYALKAGTHHRSDPTVIGGNLLSDSAIGLIAEFDTSKQLRPDVTKPVWHNSLRLPCGETLSNEQWVMFADDYMKRMGFNDTHLRCYVLHDDLTGQHIHIIASRIDLNGGKLYLGRNENLISTRIISELEIVHGLTITKAASSTKPAQPKRKRISRNEQMQEARTSSSCPKKSLQCILDKSLIGKPDLNTFIKRLEDSKVTCKANVGLSGKMSGFSFEYDGIAFKASQIGKKYSWSNLQKLLNYEPEHAEALRTGISPIPRPLQQSVVQELPVSSMNVLPMEWKGESLTISEKIASLTPAIAVNPVTTASTTLPFAHIPNLTLKTIVKDNKRQQILNAVFNLQNTQKIKKVRPRHFMLWIPFVNLLKLFNFCLLYAFKKFRRIIKIRSLTLPLSTKSSVSVKQSRQ
ncbi:relaxase/mobilization nuclease domain-containing protein [Yersinia enterocolitica]|uniref:relaxase/mobilization nuclease domain-containing protein n=1 Tax=Yersinia enterocolitica TaxID=630 RepID=UPI0005E90C6B|nr:relaxase/mobilization nuclease domain-containing protein [Yersinia enterocolitica]CQH56382.1 repetative plasmid-related protein [Yersinia enterocolitica]